MRYVRQTRNGLWQAAVLTVTLVWYAAQNGSLMQIDEQAQVKVIGAVVLYLLVMGLIFRTYFLLKAVRVDETGVTIERRFGGDLFYPRENLHVEYRRKVRGGAEGLLLERTDREDAEPYFLQLGGFSDEVKDELRQRLLGRGGL